MNEFIENIGTWSSQGKSIAIARVISTWGSSPRPTGSIMLINSDGQMAGSVSGGCVEGAVVKSALGLLEKHAAEKLQFGVSDEDAWSVGLSCGGKVQVYVQTLKPEEPVWSTLIKNLSENQSSILISSLHDGKNQNCLVDTEGNSTGDVLADNLVEEALEAYSERKHKIVTHEGQEYFIQVFPRKAHLLIVGAAHITVDLVSLGKQFGFETIVIDPRGYFTKNTTFNDAPDQLLEAYPSEVLDQFPLDAYTFCTILSHDPKIDDNALQILLPSKVGYIGALGSRKTHAKRTARLLENGISQELIDRIKAPIGMPIHAKSAKEIALAILGEIIQAKNEHL